MEQCKSLRPLPCPNAIQAREFVIADTAHVFEQMDAPVDADIVAAVAAEAFGIDGRVEKLSGERDLNFKLDSRTGESFVIKISNSNEAFAISDVQTQALIHIERTAPDLPVPRIVPALDGLPHYLWHLADRPPVLVRLLSFLGGSALNDSVAGDATLASIGRSLALLGLALSDFSHVGDRHSLLWDLRHIDRSHDMISAIGDPARRALAAGSLDNFEHRVAPRIDSLRTQVIHNDLHPWNILVGENQEVCGLLDFGDAARAPLVNDIAIAAAYHVRDRPSPFAAIAILVKHYHATRPLMDEELDILIPLIIARLSKIVTISAWRAERHPENRAYILRNAEAAWRALEQLLDLNLEQASADLSRAVTAS